jgi:hypothetical protein
LSRIGKTWQDDGLDYLEGDQVPPNVEAEDWRERQSRFHAGSSAARGYFA